MRHKYGTEVAHTSQKCSHWCLRRNTPRATELTSISAQDLHTVGGEIEKGRHVDFSDFSLSCGMANRSTWAQKSLYHGCFVQRSLYHFLWVEIAVSFFHGCRNDSIPFARSRDCCTTCDAWDCYITFHGPRHRSITFVWPKIAVSLFISVSIYHFVWVQTSLYNFCLVQRWRRDTIIFVSEITFLWFSKCVREYESKSSLIQTVLP